MSEKDKLRAADPDPGLEWAKLWQTMAESSNRMFEAWSGSMAPFMLARLSEKPAGFGDGNELSAAIERDGAGASACRRLGHRPQAGAGLQRLDRNAPASCELQRGGFRAVERGVKAVFRRDVRGRNERERRHRTGARLSPSGAKSPMRNSSATSAPTAFSRPRRSCFRPDCSCETGRMMSRRPPQPCSVCRRARISTM